jgi:pimeloyl-ACP methyl ester carboxylesterase
MNNTFTSADGLLRRRLQRPLAQGRHVAFAARSYGQLPAMVSMGAATSPRVPSRAARPSRPRQFQDTEAYRRLLAVVTGLGCSRPARLCGRNERAHRQQFDRGYASQQLAIRHPESVKTLALFGSTPNLKRSHAPTWIPKIRATDLKQFLAGMIDERFDSSADPEPVKWFIEQAGSNDPAFIARFVLHMCTHEAHNICDGYASSCVDDLINFLKNHA